MLPKGSLSRLMLPSGLAWGLKFLRSQLELARIERACGYNVRENVWGTEQPLTCNHLHTRDLQAVSSLHLHPYSRSRALFFNYFSFEIGASLSCQAGLELLDSSDGPTSVPRVTGSAGGHSTLVLWCQRWDALLVTSYCQGHVPPIGLVGLDLDLGQGLSKTTL